MPRFRAPAAPLRLPIAPCGLLPSLCLCLGLSGCAGPSRLDLPERDGLAPTLAALKHDGAVLQTPLTLDAVAILVVQNNPDLRAVRAQAGVARAQLLQAGILPNPSVTGAILPLAAGIGDTTAWNAGLTEDVRALILLRSRRQAARATAQQVDAQILWQEWQTIGRAWLLAVQIAEGDRARRLLDQSLGLYARRDRASEQAMLQGNATLSAVAPDRAALQGAKAQARDLARLQQQRRHELAALMGLMPDAPLPLADATSLPPEEPAAIEAMLPSLARRRPDLVALQLGYRAENARLRGALLARFPNLVFGVTGGSDNSNVRNVGPQVTLELPIFDRNQGGIAIETATRQQLNAEYAARLASSVGQVRAMLSEQAFQQQQIRALKRELVQAQADAVSAANALSAGNLDERSAVDMIATRFSKEVELVAIEQSIAEQQVAIAALLGLGMRPVSLPGSNG